MNRTEKRMIVAQLVSIYSVSYAVAKRAVESGQHWRVVALCEGETDKTRAFNAAVNALCPGVKQAKVTRPINAGIAKWAEVMRRAR